MICRHCGKTMADSQFLGAEIWYCEPCGSIVKKPRLLSSLLSGLELTTRERDKISERTGL